LAHKWLKYCKKHKISADDLLGMAQDVVFNHRGIMLKYIYNREQEQHPEMSAKEIRRTIAKQFNIDEKTLEKFLYCSK
jgi:hypothetical protein